MPGSRSWTGATKRAVFHDWNRQSLPRAKMKNDCEKDNTASINTTQALRLVFLPWLYQGTHFIRYGVCELVRSFLDSSDDEFLRRPANCR